MAITKKVKRHEKHDLKVKDEGVLDTEMPSVPYVIGDDETEITGSMKSILADIRTTKNTVWGRISNHPMKTEFQLLNEPGVNIHDKATIRTLCETKPEYMHFLLPHSLREKFMEADGESVLTTKDFFSSNSASQANEDFMIDESSRLLDFEDARDSALLSKIVDMTYKTVAKAYLPTLGEKTAKQAEITAIMDGIDDGA